METNWFKIWPSRFIGVINRIPDQSLRGDILLIAFHMLNEPELKDDDAEIAWVTGLSPERVETLRPYLERLKEKNRQDGRLMFDFVLETIVERQVFADKKAKAGQSGGKAVKAELIKPEKPEAQQSSAKHSKAVQSKTEQNQAIHTDIHVVLDKSSTTPDGASPPSASRKKPSDPRKDHRAITTIRTVASAYPPKEIWDDLIAILGSNPDKAKLEACRKEWVKRGYKPTNWAWVTEWYVNGITSAINAGSGSQSKAEDWRDYAPQGNTELPPVRAATSTFSMEAYKARRRERRSAEPQAADVSADSDLPF